MIRFACPGCNATYAVEDSKGGKAGRCPKCQARFLIPLPEKAATPPPLPEAEPPVEENDSVEIAPCPGCKARLSVAVSDLGADVECPHCQTVYTARRPGGSSAGRRALLEEDEDETPVRRGRRDVENRPSRRGREEIEEEEDRPARKRRVVDEEDEEETRPRRRRRDEEDLEERRPRRKKRRRVREVAEPSGEVTRVAISSFTLGGLCLLCSCVGLLGGSFVTRALAEQQQEDQGDFEANGEELIDPDMIGTVLLLFGGFYLLFGVALIVGGIGLTARKSYGRYITFGTASLAMVHALLVAFGAISNLVQGQSSGLCGGVVGILLWGGFGVSAFLTMLNHGDEFS